MSRLETFYECFGPYYWYRNIESYMEPIKSNMEVSRICSQVPYPIASPVWSQVMYEAEVHSGWH